MFPLSWVVHAIVRELHRDGPYAEVVSRRQARSHAAAARWGPEIREGPVKETSEGKEKNRWFSWISMDFGEKFI